MTNKINLMNEYIHRCDDALQSQDIQQAKTLFLEIVSVYETEIPNFWNGLKSDNGRAIPNWEYINPYWLADLPIVKAKLINYTSTFTSKQNPSSHIFINNSYATSNANASAHIDFETDIKIVQYKISEMDSLSAEETKIALQKLEELLKIAQSTDNRKTKWQKLGSIFKWIADKSVELAVAFAPALMNVIRSL